MFSNSEAPILRNSQLKQYISCSIIYFVTVIISFLALLLSLPTKGIINITIPTFCTQTVIICYESRRRRTTVTVMFSVSGFISESHILVRSGLFFWKADGTVTTITAVGIDG